MLELKVKLENAIVLYKGNKLAEAEQSFAAILKSSADDHIQVEAALGLARIHCRKREVQHLLQAAALYQYGLNLCQANQEKQFKEEITELEEALFKKLGVKSSANEADTIAQLTRIREKIKRQSVDSNQLPKKVKRLYKSIAKSMQDFIKSLMATCDQQLGAPPEGYQYAIIGLGSFSRRELTPYSDLEFAILINEEIANSRRELTPYSDLEFAILVNKEIAKVIGYFQRFTQLLHYKIIRLGETILPAMAIPCLNDFSNTKSIHFFDSRTKRGFSLDGLMPHACKYPIGRPQTDKQKDFQLIHTVKAMRELRESTEFESELHMDTVLSNGKFLDGNREQLLITYRQNIYAAKKFNRAKAIILLQNSLTDFAPALQEQTNEGKIYHVKKDLYRLPSLLLEGLGLYFSIKANSNFEVIHKLLKGKHITPESAQHLRTLLAIGLQMRIQNYLTNGQQDDNLAVTESLSLKDPTQQSSSQKSINFLEDQEDLLMQFYFRLLPFHKTVEHFLSGSNNGKRTGILKEATLHDDSAKIKGLIYKRILKPQQAFAEFETAKDQDDAEAANYYAVLAMQLGENDSANSILNKLANKEDLDDLLRVKVKLNQANLAILTKNYQDAKQQLSLIKSDIEQADKQNASTALEKLHINLLYTLGECERRCFNLAVAKGYFEKSLEKANEQKLSKDNAYFSNVWNSLGFVNKQLANYTEALKYYQDAHKLALRLYGHSAHYSLYPPLFNMANLYFELADYTQAKHYAEYAKQILEVAPIADTAHKATAYSDLGMIYDELGEHSTAKGYLMKAYTIDSKNIGILNNLAVLEIKRGDGDKRNLNELRAILKDESRFSKLSFKEKSTIYNTVAMDLSDNDSQKINYLESALQELKTGYYNIDHPEIAKVLDNLGAIQSDFNKLNEAFEMRKRLFNDKPDSIKDKPHQDTANSLDNLGQYYLKKNNIQEAFEYIKNALRMRRLFFQNKPHSDTANSLHNLGQCHLKKGNAQQAFIYVHQALMIRLKLYQTINHPTIADSFFSIALVLEKQGRVFKAIESYRKALSIYNKISSIPCEMIYKCKFLVLSSCSKAMIAIYKNFKLYDRRTKENPELYNNLQIIQQTDVAILSDEIKKLIDDKYDEIYKAYKQLRVEVGCYIKNSESAVVDEANVKKKQKNKVNNSGFFAAQSKRNHRSYDKKMSYKNNGYRPTIS